MFDLHNLVMAGKDDFMLAHDGAAPDGGDANLFFVPGAVDGAALKHIFRLMAAALGCRVSDHQGGAAGGVHFPAVVALHDLNVIAVSQNRGRLLNQFQQYIDAKRHVAGPENRDLQSGGPDLGHLFRGIAGGGQYQGNFAGPAEGQQAV